MEKEKSKQIAGSKNSRFGKISNNSSDILTDFSSIQNLMLTKDIKLKLGIVIASTYVVASIFVSIISSFIQKETRILTFDYSTNINTVFSLNIVMFYIYLIFISLINVFLIYLLVQEKDAMVLKLIYSELHLFFLLAQIFSACPFIIGVFFSHNYFALISSVSFNILVVILICFYYKSIKEKINMTLGTFITIFSYTSIIFSFAVYTTFYNICEIFLQSISHNESINIDDVKNILAITSHAFYLIISIVLLTYFKDVLFSITLIYFYIGYLLSNTLDTNLLLSIVIILTFNLLAVVLTFIKYGKFTFGLKDDDETLEDMLIARQEHKRSSWFHVDQY